MSKTCVKTKYNVQGANGKTKTLYCKHNHSSDYVTFYDQDGVPFYNEDCDTQIMCFHDWETGNDLWNAMNRLWFPYKDEWGISDLKDGVELYNKAPWEVDK